MNRRRFVISTFSCAVGLSVAPRIIGQTKEIELDLAAFAEKGKLILFNRGVSSLNDTAKRGVRLSENPAMGLAYLQAIEFSNGTIECEVRGKDVQQHSFIGVAFHGIDETTYERSTSVRSTSRLKTRKNAATPYSTSLIPPLRGRSCELNSRGNTSTLSTRCPTRMVGSTCGSLSRARR